MLLLIGKCSEPLARCVMQASCGGSRKDMMRRLVMKMSSSCFIKVSILSLTKMILFLWRS
jgi:hypothetical protein